MTRRTDQRPRRELPAPWRKCFWVDLEVWEQLQARAAGLIDTPNDVLRRLFGLPPRQGRRRREPSAIPTIRRK